MRDEVDGRIKGILAELGYDEDRIRIQPRYNIGRFHVKYTNAEGVQDSLKVEIGYTRRIPVLREDARMTFRHPLTGSRAIIRTPYPEELFANKFCTMLSRKGPGAYPRDVFDVATFSTVQVDHGLLVDVVFVDALMCELDLSDMRMRPLALEQMGSLRALVGQDVEENEVLERATLFFEGVQEVVMERDWKSFQEAFWADGSVVIDVLENPDAINPAIEEHPLLRWVRERPDRAR